METQPEIDKFRAVITRFADGAPTQSPVRLAVEYRREKSTPIFIRSLDEVGATHCPDEFDQVQLLEAYHEHRWHLS